MYPPPIRFPVSARLLLCTESLVVGVLAAVILWALDAPRTGFWVGLAGIGLAVLAWLWTKRTLLLSTGALTLRGGPLFCTQRVLRRRWITGIYCIATPLFRLYGFRLVVLFTPAGRIYLPGLLQADACRLLDWYRK